MSAAVRGVLFDAAGTLIELREPVGETYARFAALHGVALPAWRLEDAFARVLAAAPPMVFPELVAAGDERAVRAAERQWWRARVRETILAADSTALLRFTGFEAFFDALWCHYAGAAAWRCRAGARTALRALAAAGVHRGIASDFDLRLGNILEELGIAREIEATALPGTSGFAKPDPRLLEAALRALGVPPEAAAYVGDVPERDGAAAREAGLRFIDVRALASLEALPARLEALA